MAYDLVRPTLLWQLRTNTRTLLVQRLWLEHFSTACRPQGELKRTRQWDTLQSIGTTFGCTLGQILAHVARPHEPHTRLLRAIRDEIMNIAAHHAHMSGDDSDLLAYGLASCSVIRNQRRKLRGDSLRIDSRYANGTAAIGACAAIIVTHAVLARFEPSAPEYFMQADNLRTTLCTADERLSQWSTRHSASPIDSEALNAERRALRRAHMAINTAMSRARTEVGTAIDQLQTQLLTATMAAYPPYRVASDNERDMEALAHAGAFIPTPCSTPSARTTVQRPSSMVVVPLSGIPGVPNNTRPTGDMSDHGSDASWITTTSSTYSDASSEFYTV